MEIRRGLDLGRVFQQAVQERRLDVPDPQPRFRLLRQSQEIFVPLQPVRGNLPETAVGQFDVSLAPADRLQHLFEGDGLVAVVDDGLYVKPVYAGGDGDAQDRLGLFEAGGAQPLLAVNLKPGLRQELVVPVSEGQVGPEGAALFPQVEPGDRFGPDFFYLDDIL